MIFRNRIQRLPTFKRSFNNYRSVHLCSINKSNNAIGSKEQKDAFENALPKLIEAVTNADILKQSPEAQERFKMIVKHNVGGKKTRGFTTACAYEAFEKPENVTEKSLELARVAGWCVEMLQGVLIMTDDIMDNSLMRRGAPCWYKRPEVGMMAISDAFLLKGAYMDIIKMYFHDKPYYTHLLELFNDTFFFTTIGQHLDSMAQTKPLDEKIFTIDHYFKIIKYKTSYYTYNLPISIGWLLTNDMDQESLDTIKEIALDLGQLFQSQDDIIDLYSDFELSGKEPVDIQEGKCTWLAVNALQKCTAQQKIVFKACYGSKETAHYERIMQLYKTLKIQDLFTEFEESERRNIKEKIRRLPKKFNPDFFMKVLDNLCGRRY